MSDLIFTIYRFKIDKLPAVQGELFDKKKHEANKTITKEQIFESLIPERNKVIDLWHAPKTKRDGDEVIEKESFNNRVLEHRDNIIVLAMQANSSKLIYREDWSKQPEPNHMPFRVIIDTLEDHCFIAIERAAMDTDKSAEILQNSFNYQLNQVGYKFEIVRLKNKLKFLDAVYHIKEKLKDNVKKLVFDFDKNLQESQKLEGRFVHALTEWIGKFADSGQLSANISNDEQLNNVEIKQELELVADLCSSNPNYNLLVRFERFGVYKYGHDIKAQFGLDENVLDLYVNLSKTTTVSRLQFDDEEDTVTTTTLPQWLDDIQKLYKDYEEEALSTKKRRRICRL